MKLILIQVVGPNLSILQHYMRAEGCITFVITSYGVRGQRTVPEKGVCYRYEGYIVTNKLETHRHIKEVKLYNDVRIITNLYNYSHETIRYIYSRRVHYDTRI